MNMLLLKTVVPIWLLTAVGAVLIAVASAPSEYLLYLPVALGSATVVTLIAQLALTRPEGFVDRVAASIAGSFVILAVTTLVLVPLTFA
ncbi:hypothetical protein [Subtercola vilae]|uniref:Uncharacterized protein n=1 Tax=Subtercola vilae TaxID=2056433 RepID=A0A4T2BZP6_9MICO|nr:hypothetical protein [Subtercola vilae]TIH37355.1 hypothetical protein D4765_08065 [Subtercola vilae]